jgi:hypothetical protein
MAINLELENGLIQKYPTSYRYYYSLGVESTAYDIKSKCNISDKCDHLDCAIYAAEYTAKDNKTHFKICIFACAFWSVIAISNLGLGLGVGGLCALFGVYNICQSDKAAKKAKELIEFRDHGTINGIKAYKL